MRSIVQCVADLKLSYSTFLFRLFPSYSSTYAFIAMIAILAANPILNNSWLTSGLCSMAWNTLKSYMAYNVQPMMRVRFNIWRGCEEGRPGGGAGIDDSRGLPASLVAGVASLLRNGAVCSKSRLIISNCFSFLFGLVICCWPDLCSNLRSRVSRCDYARFQLLACACA